MNVDWIFLAQDGSRATRTLVEPSLPQVGQGKWHGGKGYVVVFVGAGMISNVNPLIVAVEHLPPPGKEAE